MNRDIKIVAIYNLSTLGFYVSVMLKLAYDGNSTITLP